MNEVLELSHNQRYFPLQEYFQMCSKENRTTVTLSIKEIEQIIGRTLPRWAFDYAAGYWSNCNHQDHVQKRAWLSQEFVVQDYQVNGKEHSGRIVFRNTNL